MKSLVIFDVKRWEPDHIASRQGFFKTTSYNRTVQIVLLAGRYLHKKNPVSVIIKTKDNASIKFIALNNCFYHILYFRAFLYSPIRQFSPGNNISLN